MNEIIEDKWSDLLPTFIKIPLKTYQYRHLLQKWKTKLMLKIGRGKSNVVVLGRPGVGKTVMLSYLKAKSGKLIWKPPNTSNKVESDDIVFDKYAKIIRVIPGQGSNERFMGLHEAFTTHKKLNGVIYVVDWGYTEIRDHISKKGLIDQDELDTVDKFREHNLKGEIEDFKKVSHEISRAFGNDNKIDWLLIAVNKIDLFAKSEKLDDAQLYYHLNGNSDFSNLLQDLTNDIGNNNLKCKVVPICSLEEDFNWNGTTVRTDLGGDSIKRGLGLNFFNTIKEL